MLEPIREYAVERLEAAGKADAIAERHARAYLELARELSPTSPAPSNAPRSTGSSCEHANLRAAIDWADARGDAELALGITIAVWRFWQKRGYLREARARVAALIAAPGRGGAGAARARTHEAAAGSPTGMAIRRRAAHYEAALAIWREIGDRGRSPRRSTTCRSVLMT